MEFHNVVMSNKHNFNTNNLSTCLYIDICSLRKKIQNSMRNGLYIGQKVLTQPSGSIANSLSLAEHGTASPGRHRWEAGCRVSNFRRHGSFLQLWLLRSPGYTLWWHWAPLLQELLCRRIHRLHLRQWTIPVHGKQAATAKIGHRVRDYFLRFDHIFLKK